MESREVFSSRTLSPSPSPSPWSPPPKLRLVLGAARRSISPRLAGGCRRGTTVESGNDGDDGDDDDDDNNDGYNDNYNDDDDGDGVDQLPPRETAEEFLRSPLGIGSDERTGKFSNVGFKSAGRGRVEDHCYIGVAPGRGRWANFHPKSDTDYSESCDMNPLEARDNDRNEHRKNMVKLMGIAEQDDAVVSYAEEDDPMAPSGYFSDDANSIISTVDLEPLPVCGFPMPQPLHRSTLKFCGVESELMQSASSMAKDAQYEVMSTFEDLGATWEQIFCVFSLKDEEIDGFAGPLGEVKRAIRKMPFQDIIGLGAKRENKKKKKKKKLRQ